MPVLAVVILFSTIFTLSDFNIVYVLTRGGPMNMTHLFATYSFALGLQGGQIGQGAAVSLFLFPILLAVVFVQLRLSCARRRFMSRKTKARWARDIRPLLTVYLPVLPYVLFALYSLVFVSPAELKTMTVGVFSELIRGDIYYWGSLMAGACIGSLPIVVAYVFFLDYYVSGLTAGAIK